MGFFGFVFWMFVVWMVFRYWQRREGRRMAGSHGYAPSTGWYDSGEFYKPKGRELKGRSRKALKDHEAYIEALESRVSELEERLDFTERLLAERRETPAG